MPDLDDRISEASGEFARPDQSDLAMPGQTSTGVSARRSRLRPGGTVPMTATVGLVLVVIAAVTLLGWLRTTHSGPQSAVPPPSAAVSPAAILQPGQFVGVIPPSRGEKQYAWVMSADGQPVRRLTQALGPVGLTGDKTQALIQQYGISGCSGLPYALVSLADGSLTAPFPGRSDISGMAIGGHMVAGISIPVAASKPIADGYWCEGRQPPQLVLRNLRTGIVATYPLPQVLARRPDVTAVSPDGRWVVLRDSDHPDHQVFYLAHLDAGTVRLASMPAEPGCTSTSFNAYPATNVLTVARACARTRTMTITSYDPDTLVATGKQTIADPPGAAVTFVAIAWARDGAQALVEAIHDEVPGESAEASGPSIYTLQNGRLTTITTTADGATW
jgi:hypothetical protein